jgi:hypothetical protein
VGNDRVVSLVRQSQIEDPMTALLRDKASELLQAAIQAECAEFLARLSYRQELCTRRDHQAAARRG